MHPVLFKINLPEWLHSFLPDHINVHSYGFFIAIGAIVGITYTAIQLKRQFGVPFEVANSLFLVLIVAAFVGGKVFFFFENPSYYADHPKALLSGSGFVFYGSLSFAIPSMLVFFKMNKLPTMKMLDIMAVTACLVHVFGRLGCFMAGCCHGIPWEGPWAVVFTDPVCQAEPLKIHRFTQHSCIV